VRSRALDELKAALNSMVTDIRVVRKIVIRLDVGPGRQYRTFTLDQHRIEVIKSAD